MRKLEFFISGYRILDLLKRANWFLFLFMPFFLFSFILMYGSAGYSITHKNNFSKTIKPKYAGSTEESLEPQSFKGVLETECARYKKLPSTESTLEEYYHWRAEGEFSSFSQVISMPAVGMIIGDVPSIVTTAFYTTAEKPARAFAINGKNGVQQWASEISVFPVSVAIGDTDGGADNDGNEVIVVGNDGYLYALFGIDGKVKWKSDEREITNLSIHPLILDMDGDKIPEVIYNQTVFDGKTGRTMYKLPSRIFGVAHQDVDRSVIVAGRGIFRTKEREQVCEFPLSIEEAAIARLRSRDRSDTVVGRYGSKLLAYSSADCEKKFAVEFPVKAETDDESQASGGAITVADFDGDEDLEIGAANSSYFVAFNALGQIKWKHAIKNRLSHVGASAFDFNADGQNEITFADEEWIRVFDGRSGTTIYKEKNISTNLTGYPVVADVNSDDHAEIVIGVNNFATGENDLGIRVLHPIGNEWAGTRQIWNQYNYNVLNVEECGSVVGYQPESNWKMWLKDERLIGYRANIPKKILTEECYQGEGRIRFDLTNSQRKDMTKLDGLLFYWAPITEGDDSDKWPSILVKARCLKAGYKYLDNPPFEDINTIKNANQGTNLLGLASCLEEFDTVEMKLYTQTGKGADLTKVSDLTITPVFRKARKSTTAAFNK